MSSHWGLTTRKVPLILLGMTGSTEKVVKTLLPKLTDVPVKFVEVHDTVTQRLTTFPIVLDIRQVKTKM